MMSRSAAVRVVLWGLLLILVDLSLNQNGVLVPRDLIPDVLALSERPHPDKPRQYSQTEIANTAPMMRSSHPRLLVFNGTMFEVYNLNHKDSHYSASHYCGRCAQLIPLLVHALKELNPPRFEPEQPVFQLLFSAGDTISSTCVNRGTCNFDAFAPLLLFGSAPTDPAVFPTAKGFPNWFYLSCLYDYKIQGVNHCKWAEPVERTMSWEELIPTVIWRGRDFTFLPLYKQFAPFQKFKKSGALSNTLNNVTTRERATKKLMDHWDELSPRWRGVALTAQAEVDNKTWIDAKFTGSVGVEVHNKFLERGVQVSTSERMDPTEMSHYKYQIDLGGGGGTTWRGTLTKLGMPGVLFHHETPTKDWFFDDMKKWIHYVPVDWTLGDLRDRFLWAQHNPKHAKRISDEASKLHEHFMQEPYMEKVYNELFVDYLGKVLDAYVPTRGPWEDRKREYLQGGFEIRRVAFCDDTLCHKFAEGDAANNHPYVHASVA